MYLYLLMYYWSEWIMHIITLYNKNSVYSVSSTLRHPFYKPLTGSTIVKHDHIPETLLLLNLLKGNSGATYFVPHKIKNEVIFLLLLNDRGLSISFNLLVPDVTGLLSSLLWNTKEWTDDHLDPEWLSYSENFSGLWEFCPFTKSK